MEKCRFEKYLVEYLNEDLPEELQSEIKQHLKNCEACSFQLQEIATIHSILLERKRPEPSSDLVDQFDQELNKIFE